LNWLDYNNETVINTLDKEIFGFVYLIGFTDGTWYIGKKQVMSKQILPALKSGILRSGAIRINKNVNGKRKAFDVLYKESNWRTYTGSKKFAENKKIKVKYILDFAESKRYLTYLEAKYLFSFGCIENEEYLNDNILGKFFRDNLI
jgi:hypothetical protein